MKQLKKICINLDDICYAMENNSIYSSNLLDTETGEVIIENNPEDEFDTEDVSEKIDYSLDHYISIPTINSSQVYHFMEMFIDTIKKQKLKNELNRAIHNKKPFRQFKTILEQNPEEQIKWNNFKNEMLKEKAEEWLSTLDIEYELVEYKKEPVENQIMKKQEQADKSIEEFIKLSSQINGITKVELFGSLSGQKKIAKDVDLMVYIENTGCIEELAKAHRKICGSHHVSLDTFILNQEKQFLGNICHRKECPGLSVDCKVPGCGEIKYIKRYPDFVLNLDEIFKTRPKLLWENSNINKK